MSKIAKQKWEPLSTIMDRISGQLPPNTLTNADGTPYTVNATISMNGRVLLAPGSEEAVRAIVREELAAMKAEVVKEVLEKLDAVERLETKTRMQVGATYFNELREKTVNDLRKEQGLPPLNFVGGICTDVVYDKDGNEVARAKTL